MERVEPVESKDKNPSDERHRDAQETKVMDYLGSCGLDPSLVSLDNIDPSSLAFLTELAEREALLSTKQSRSDADGGGEEKQQTGDDDVAVAASQVNAVDLAVSVQNEKTEVEMNREMQAANASIRMVRSTSGDTEKPAQTADDPIFFRETNKLLQNARGSYFGPRGTGSKIAEHVPQPRPSNDNNDVVDDDPLIDINYEGLEPWQRALFQRLEKQQRHIEKLESEVQQLTQIVKMSGSSLRKNCPPSSILESTTTARRQETQSTVPPTEESETTVGAGANANAGAGVADDNVNANNPRRIPDVLQIPRLIHRRIMFSRPIRILKLFRLEAANFRQPGNQNARFFDVHLMFKLSFICLFLRARMTSNERRNGGGSGNDGGGRGGSILNEVFALTNQHSAVILLISAVIVYFIQTGLILFLHQVLVKDNIIGRVWRDEDLVPGEVEGQGRGLAEGVRDQGQRGGANGNDNANGRRGRRDRAPVGQDGDNRNGQGREIDDGPALAADDNDDGVNNGNDNGNRNRNLFQFGQMRQAARAGIDNTFIGGVIEPADHRAAGIGMMDNNGNAPINVPREEIFLIQMLEGMRDVLYLIGAFFLSLFPMWHPRARERPVVVAAQDVNNNENVQNNHHNGNDNVEVEGRGGGGDGDHAQAEVGGDGNDDEAVDG